MDHIGQGFSDCKLPLQADIAGTSAIEYDLSSLVDGHCVLMWDILHTNILYNFVCCVVYTVNI